MYSRTDDWDFSAERIALDFSDGIKSIRSALVELENEGFLTREKQATGQMIYFLWIEPKCQKGVLRSESPKCRKGKVPKRQSAEKAPLNNIDIYNNIKSISSLHSDIDLEKSQNFENSENSFLENSEKISETEKNLNSEKQNLSNTEPPHPPTPLAPALENNSFDYLDDVAEKFRNQEAVYFPDWVGDADRTEFFKFLLYWTETDSRGKIRAKKEKVFEIRRRFAYWLSRSKPSNVSPNQARNRIG
ncbi:hypothetical protein BLM37_03185 [Candidatus Gracilibacteria bacterium GN02-873]|nr:hypothetical protein BLM37_03185 [Candidatus Gracilibacteria bacterium GN02-873]